MSITSISMRGGESPWVNAVVSWTGVSTTWTLTDTTTGTPIYVGPGLTYTMDTTPETIYHLMLADDSGTQQEFSYVTPPISAPVNLQAVDITATAATLQWSEQQGATHYVLTIDETEHTVPASPEPMLQATGLDQDRTYTAKVRAYINTFESLLSPAIYFTTERTIVAEASDYEYEPIIARTWCPTGWLTDGSDLIHGSGELFGDTNGIYTTVFVYSSDDLGLLRELKGVRVLSAYVSITRLPAGSDPRMVLSHWLLHNMADIPSGEPVFLGDALGVDSGSVALGQQAWMTIPTGWIDAIINDEAAGFGWGGVSNRYQRAYPINDPSHPISPKNGTLRITVG